MNARTAGIVSYITWIGWIIALISTGTSDEFIKHHMNQSLVLLLLSTISGIVFGALGSIPIIGWLFIGVAAIVNIVLFILAIMGIISASDNATTNLPLVGGIKILK